MKKSIYTLGLAGVLLFSGVMTSCTDQLDIPPKGVVSDDQLATPLGADGLVTSAYKALTAFVNIGSAFNAPATNWSFSDVRSDDAYKGGGGVADQEAINQMETHVRIMPNHYDGHMKWKTLYVGISRSNKAIKYVTLTPDADYPEKQTRLAEARFLRGHFYFDLKRIYNRVPWIHEGMESREDFLVSNREFTSEEIWDKIEADFTFAYENLPESQPEVGRANKYAAAAYLAKLNLYRKDWIEAEKYADVVISSGMYHLLPSFEMMSQVDNEHAGEFIFAVEHSTNDGTDNANTNLSNLLNVPRGPYSGDGFFHASQNIVNAFKVDANGLPLFESFNSFDYLPGDADFVDPRLDHTVGRPGIAWKESGVFDTSWLRDVSTYGVYHANKKNLVCTTSPHMLEGFPWGGSPLNFPLIRYADVLLMKAEAQIEQSKLADAVGYINQVRDRARTSTYVKTEDGSTDAANYRIGLYSNFSSQEYARKALQFERRLELAFEGHRFFDLVRWGIVEQTLDTYFAKEKQSRLYLEEADFVGGKHEYMPIPQVEIDLSGGLYEQNENY